MLPKRECVELTEIPQEVTLSPETNLSPFLFEFETFMQMHTSAIDLQTFFSRFCESYRKACNDISRETYLGKLIACIAYSRERGFDTLQFPEGWSQNVSEIEIVRITPVG